MKQPHHTLVPPEPIEAGRRSKPQPFDLPPKLVLGCVALIAGFSIPLFQWARFALQSELFSYVLLVPVISVYVFAVQRKKSYSSAPLPRRATGALLIAGGLAALGIFWLAKLSGSTLAVQDAVALTTLAFVLLLAAFFTFGLNPADLRRAIFPLVFLLFMVPFPLAMEQGLEAFLQRGSAPPAYWLLRLVGTPVFREDMVFQLPGISLQIAPECSGIRSTVVLFMTSVLAGHLFLRSPWKRALLAVFVIPLALVRNGFRIFTIGELCVHVGPHMIDSIVHHRGGPIFFGLSLVPFFLVLYLLIRSERSGPKPEPRAVTS